MLADRTLCIFTVFQRVLQRTACFWETGIRLALKLFAEKQARFLPKSLQNLVFELGRFNSQGPATAWETSLCQADAPVMHPPMEEDEDEVSGREDMYM